ncbi:MAG: phosphate/phosphite/phosphonate ABC transporter substrate-binding protein [Deltaproteobacteria bacterium]|nr:MAG: phosphate/phosphite/phosphonate ABC transporter substrate-binding protein [Deltaproteobacteria bacterium]
MKMRKRFVSICVVFLAGMLLIFPARTFAKQVFSFGFCPKYNPRIMYQLYQPFIDYLNENTPYQFEMKLSRNYQEMIDQFGQGKITIASCGPVPYLKAREKYAVSPILRALSRDGKSSYQGIIFVRQDSPIQNLADLKGKRFAFGEPWSTAGHILPLYSLQKAKITLRDLKTYSFLRHHDSVIYGVIRGEFDAGAVKDIVAYRYEKEGLRFIHITDPIPTVPIVVRADAPREMVESVKSALLKLNPEDPANQKRMAQWDEEFKYGFTKASDSDYDPIRRILRKIPVVQEMKGRAKE